MKKLNTAIENALGKESVCNILYKAGMGSSRLLSDFAEKYGTKTGAGLVWVLAGERGKKSLRFLRARSLPGYAGNLNNNNGWIKADVPLLIELGVVADESMVGLIVDEIAEPIVEAEEQVIALVVDMDEDIAMLFGDDDFEDDASEGFDEEEVWEVNEEWLMAPVVTPPLMPAMPPPSVYEVGGPSTAAAEGSSFPLPTPGLPIPPSVIEDLSTRLGNLEYEHGQLVKKVIQVSDAEVAAGVSIREIGPRILAIERHVQVEQGQQTATQRDEDDCDYRTQAVQALQAAVQQRDL
ncbi:hypothetical protein Tco_0267922 [Tanacetum coccineum]